MKRLPGLRALLRRPTGGQVPPPRPNDTSPVTLNTGGRITDQDEAEALGLTAEARRMRNEEPTT